LRSTSSPFFHFTFFIFHVVQFGHEHFHGQFFVFELRSFLGAFDANARGFVQQIDGGLDFVDVLCVWKRGETTLQQ
jgi:hypothetical protein